MAGGFILWWPIGLAVLAYLLWSGSMGRVNGQWWERAKATAWPFTGGGTGNAAFDAHRKATLDRLEAERRKLEEEQRDFAVFLDKLRHAKDQSDFDDFLKARGGA